MIPIGRADWSEAIRRAGIAASVQVPLMEDDILACPDALRPSAIAIATLRDKAAFRDYAERERLDYLCPARTTTFPCMLKRTDSFSGTGVALVHSQTQLDTLLAQDPWLGHPWILQEHVPDGIEYVTHMVAKDGVALWRCTYEYSATKGRTTKRPTPFAEAVEAFLAPLAFSGPCCANYKIVGGHMKLFEINPRIGGSLMRDENRSDLREALTAIAGARA